MSDFETMPIGTADRLIRADFIDNCRDGVVAASAGLMELAQANASSDLTSTEVVENLAEATLCAIRARDVSDHLTDQLAAALEKFVEGWVR